MVNSAVCPGVGYLINNAAGSCQAGPLNEGMSFSRNVNKQQVRMETPREFFKDSTINYQYAGSVSVF